MKKHERVVGEGGSSLAGGFVLVLKISVNSVLYLHILEDKLLVQFISADSCVPKERKCIFIRLVHYSVSQI